jgi:hypothetical protein
MNSEEIKQISLTKHHFIYVLRETDVICIPSKDLLVSDTLLLRVNTEAELLPTKII